MAKGTSEAHDLSLFRPEEPRLRAVNSSEKAVEIKTKKDKHARLMRSAYTVFISALLVISLVLMIVLNVKATEMDDEADELTEQLKILQSENKRLKNERSANTSQEILDQYVEDNELQKPDQNQVVLVTVDGGDKIVVSDPEPEGWIEKIGAAIAGWFGG